MKSSGWTERPFREGSLFHIPHADEERIQNFSADHRQRLRTNARNKAIARSGVDWEQERFRVRSHRPGEASI